MAYLIRKKASLICDWVNSILQCFQHIADRIFRLLKQQDDIFVLLSLLMTGWSRVVQLSV